MSLFAAMAAFAVSALRACADHTVNLCVAPQWNVKVRHLTFCSAVGCTANSKIQDVYVWASDVDDGSGLCGAAFLAYVMPALSVSVSFIPRVCTCTP